MVAMRSLDNNNQEKQVRRQQRELKLSLLIVTNSFVLSVLMKSISLNKNVDQSATKMGEVKV